VVGREGPEQVALRFQHVAEAGHSPEIHQSSQGRRAQCSSKVKSKSDALQGPISESLIASDALFEPCIVGAGKTQTIMRTYVSHLLA
jgi:hypothetical protein